MTVSHAAEDAVLGGERTSDGLWTHRGKLVVRSALELQPPQQPAGSSASLVLPNGSVPGSALTAGAAQALIGSYLAPTTFSTTSGASVLTPITTGSVACTGALCRVEFSSTLSHTVVSGAFYTGLSLDGAAQWNLSLTNEPVANYVVAVAWVVYVTPAVGNHTFTVHVLNASGGTLSISSSIYSALYVTEQRR